MNQMQRMTDELDRLENEIFLHDSRSYTMKENGDRLYSLELHPRKPWVITGHLTGSHPVATFRSREDAERFAIAANAALKSVFLAFGEGDR